MPARRKKTRISKIGAALIRGKRAGGKVGRYSKRSTGVFIRDSHVRGVLVRGSSGSFIVRGGVSPKRAGHGSGGADAGPVGGIFDFGDPTLARRVEEEVYGRAR